MIRRSSLRFRHVALADTFGREDGNPKRSPHGNPPAFERSPDGGKDLARDTRVRWALEEVRQYDESGLALFKTGAIELRIAERHARLTVDKPVYKQRLPAIVAELGNAIGV